MSDGNEPIVDPNSGEDDQQVEKSLRPKRLLEFICQENIVDH